MKRILVFIAAIATASACYAEEVTFYIGQSNNDWAFTVTGKGKALVGKTLVYSDYEYVKIVNNPKHAKLKRVKYIDLDYAYSLPDGQWDVKSSGARKVVNKTLKPGEWMTINWVNSKLNLEGEPASKYWIIVTVGTDEGLVHAHSRRDIFNNLKGYASQ